VKVLLIEREIFGVGERVEEYVKFFFVLWIFSQMSVSTGKGLTGVRGDGCRSNSVVCDSG
jgi:hypothetical protein